MRKIVPVIGLLLVSQLAFAGSLRMGNLPAPDLVSPGDDLDITGKSVVEFRWSNEGDSGLQYYDFRLYKGSQPYEQYALLKERVPRGKTSFEVKADVFEKGKTYNWSLCAIGSNKGRRVYSVFKVKE